MTHTRTSLRMLILLALLGLVLGAAACGSDDDGGDSGGGEAAADAGDSAPADAQVDGDGGGAGGSQAAGDEGGEASSSGSGDEQAIRAAQERLQYAFYNRDGERFCAGLTEQVAERFGSADDVSCPAAVRSVIPEPLPRADIEKYRSRIASVVVDGDRAKVKFVQVSETKVPPVEFVNEDGTWKLATPLDAGRP